MPAAFALPLVAAGIRLPLLGEMVIMFIAAVLIAYLSYKVRMVPIVGFLLAGAIVGPQALGLVQDQELINGSAELGVILLLFTIGAEFSLESLGRIGRTIFIAGGLQVGLTILVSMAVVMALGSSWENGFFTGCIVALSSTAIVLSLLRERAEVDSPSGNLSLAILIFQDLAVVAMVLVIPLLKGAQGSLFNVGTRLMLAFVIIGTVMIMARRAVPWLLEKVAATRRSEIFLLTVVAICLGTAWLTSLFGVSLALGAFLGGLIVSESRYSEHALSELLPLRTIFNAIFFVSVGMLLDVRFLVEHWPMILAVAGGLLLLKILTAIGGVMAMGFPIRVAATVGFSLAQVGEFSFVLEQSGEAAGLLPMGMEQGGGPTFIAVSVLLMLATPALVNVAPRIGMWLTNTPVGKLGKELEPQSAHAASEHAALEDHVIIVGYGPAGQRLVQVLRESGIPFVVIEMNPRAIRELQGQGCHAIYGDAARGPILQLAGVDRAKLLVIAINDRSAAHRMTQLAHFANPTIEIVVRTRFFNEIERLQKAGADVVVPEELETSIRIFTHVLGAYMISPEEINQHISAIRSGDYKVFRGSIHEAHLMVLQGLDEEGLHTRAVAVRQGAPIAGKTLAELELRQRYALNVLAIRRGAHTIGNPGGDFRLEAGDRLVLIATADQFAQTAFLFRPAPSEQPS